MTNHPRVESRLGLLDEATYYKCGSCGYEFLSKTKDPPCPHCENRKLEIKDIGTITGFDE
jgi:rubrerythrin